MYVNEHVLLGSPGFIPDHLQSRKRPQSRSKLPQAGNGITILARMRVAPRDRGGDGRGRWAARMSGCAF
ncbi:hypothetical protein GCM10012278_67550 [Nonomuraea glycinis]|uniref:Uncharacterized protein n=1 Tax=Nonomuraea glycinis TaxID=2047744 RepID=A0A918AEF1_9ACTN|nr:hypothetical protein GCM10012278_67550 [Nonomuraea glycinis]